jgi:hypothetical protein
MTALELATRIEHRFRSRPSKPFPYNDVELLIRSHRAAKTIVVDLDIFFSAIAGYADSARALSVCDNKKLLKARRDVSRSFFELFPSNKPCQESITEESTPDLHAELRLAEELRGDLLLLLDRVLAP